MDSERTATHPISLRDTEHCRCELKAFAELLRLQQHDLHSFQIVEELEDEVARAVTAFNSLSDNMGYEPVNVNQVNTTILNSLKKDWFKKVRTHEHGILKLDRSVFSAGAN